VEEETKESVRRERAKRRKHEREAIVGLLFVLSGEVGEWREFYRKKKNNKKI